MRAISIIAAATLGAAGLAAPARADDALGPDVRCATIAFYAVAQAKEDQKLVASLGAIYFLGKVDGAAPKLDLEARIRQEVASMKPEQIQAEARRCSAELARRGQEMTEIGARLQAPPKP